MRQADTHVVVVGAGIGGLTCAIALRQSGFEVTVLERRSEAGPVGSGLMLWGDTLDVLDTLGVGGAVAQRAGVIHHSELRDPTGRPVEGLWVGSFLGKNPDARPPVCVHRALLHEVLLDAVGRDRVLLGHSFENFSVTGDRVEVVVSGGPAILADVLVGADGINSSVRRRLFPGAEPRYDGQTLFRGLTPPMTDGADDVAYVAIGDGCRFGWEPIHDGSLYWFGGRFQPEHTPDHPQGHKVDLMETFAGWAEPVSQLIEGTPEERILRNDIYVVGPLPAWGDGSVSLLGDAAHAVAPHIGQGACLAIDDAATLAEELRTGPAPAALRRYEVRRQEATKPFYDTAARLRAGLATGSLITGRAAIGGVPVAGDHVPEEDA